MATRRTEKETAGKLFIHKENIQKKYFICLSEIRTPIIYFYFKITLLILRNIRMFKIYIFKKYINIF